MARRLKYAETLPYQCDHRSQKQRTINISATLAIASAIWSKHKLARQLKSQDMAFVVFLLPM